MTPGIGHNRGPASEPGFGFRRHAWAKARRDLLPTLPLEVIRLRVRRAAELGLDYRTYATVRATTDCDIVAFLFSSNALRISRDGGIEPGRARRIAVLAGARHVALIQPPLAPDRVLAANPELIEAAARAPGLIDDWPRTRAAVEAVTVARGLPRDGVLVVGDAPFERDWCAAGRLAGYITGDRYFGTVQA